MWIFTRTEIGDITLFFVDMVGGEPDIWVFVTRPENSPQGSQSTQRRKTLAVFKQHGKMACVQ
jgi:hypothetical protein